MIEPASHDPKETPIVTLGGRSWPIPRLAPRQLRHIWEQVNTVTRALNASSQDQFGDRVLTMTNEQFEALQNVVYWGLKRAHPDMTEDDFLDMEASPVELVSAFLVVRAQTGMFRSVTPEEAAEQKEGEAEGASQPQDQTGIA